MIKSEFIQLCKENKIRIPFLMIFDLYKDDEDISKELIEILFAPPKPQKYIVYGNTQFFEQLDLAIDEEIKKFLK